jgi:hypothetical protein
MKKQTYAIGTVLHSSADFDNCIFFMKWIQIQKNGFIVDPGGFIEEHDAKSVVINGGFYLKDNWTFVVSEKLGSTGGN